MKKVGKKERRKEKNTHFPTRAQISSPHVHLIFSFSRKALFLVPLWERETAMIYITDPDDDTTLSKRGAGTFDPEIGWCIRPSGEVFVYFRRKIGSQSHQLIIDKISKMLHWWWQYTSELVKPNKRFRIQRSYFPVLTYSFSLNSDFRLSVVKRFVASSWWFLIVRSLSRPNHWFAVFTRKEYCDEIRAQAHAV